MKLLSPDGQPGLPGEATTTTTPLPANAPAPAVSSEDRLKAIEAEVGNALNLAGNIAGAIDPALIPFIVLGKAAAAAIPGLIDDVTAMIEGTAPSDLDNAALAAKIASLGSPETL